MTVTTIDGNLIDMTRTVLRKLSELPPLKQEIALAATNSYIDGIDAGERLSAYAPGNLPAPQPTTT